MLIISRKSGERIRVRFGDMELWIEVIPNQDFRGKVRLGFEAPREVEVMRQELITPEAKGGPECPTR